MAITAFTSTAIIDATTIGTTVLTALSEGIAADAIGLGTTDSPTFVNGTFTGTVTVDTINASGSTLDLQLGSSTVLKANSSFSYYYAGGGNTYILQGSDFFRPQGGAAPFDLGGTSHRWRTVFGEKGSFSGNLDTEVGGSNRIFNLGSDADVAAGNTEYLETSWDTNAATISTKNTGAGVKRNLHLGDSAVPKTRIAGARVEILDGLLFAAVFDSGSSTFYGSGIRPISDGVQECGFSSARWVNVHSVDGDFSGDVVMAANVDFTGLPTSDPLVAGRLWNDSGTIKISAG